MAKIQQKAIALVNDNSFKQLGGEKTKLQQSLDLDAAINIAYQSSSKEEICTIVKHNIPAVELLKKDKKIVILKH